MIPVKFPESNRTLTANPAQPEIDGNRVGDLYVFANGVQCISCWKLSFLERVKALLFGRVWLGVHAGGTQPPVWMDVTRTVFTGPKDKRTEIEPPSAEQIKNFG